jgi:TPR repeat protein
MAQREVLHMIRAARAGQAIAQLALGRHYLFGGAGLPKNSSSALYWLDRAAQQQQQDAWMLIGSYIPFETATHDANIHKLFFWYERAFEAGVHQAGLVLVRLVLSHAVMLSESDKCVSALRALHACAEAGLGEAQWLLAQHCRTSLFPAIPSSLNEKIQNSLGFRREGWLYWAECAANKGIEAARQSLMDYAWEKADYRLFLKWAALPVDAILQAAARSEKVASTLSMQDIELLKKYAQILDGAEDGSAADKRKACLQIAANAGDAQAQLELGLLLAGMDARGRRLVRLPGRAVYKAALRWLKAASEQGLAEAAYAVSRIYSKPEFSQRSLELADEYLKRAAEAGHLSAQLEWGLILWRRRSLESNEDVQALYWLCRAAAQGSLEAQTWVSRIAPASEAQSWAAVAARQLRAEQVRAYPYLAARIELAQQFGLSRAEALLIDPVQADQGHCLVVDIRSYHPRSKRRLIVIPDGEPRQVMDRIRGIFHDADCSERGPEGNYRQRLYRLKCLAAEGAVLLKSVPGVIARSRPQIPSQPVPSS